MKNELFRRILGRKLYRFFFEFDFGYFKYLLQRQFAIKILRYKQADIEYPRLGQRCKIFGSSERWRYTYDADLIPEFAETEKEKREWYRFVSKEDMLLFARVTLWKDWS